MFPWNRSVRVKFQIFANVDSSFSRNGISLFISKEVQFDIVLSAVLCHCIFFFLLTGFYSPLTLHTKKSLSSAMLVSIQEAFHLITMPYLTLLSAICYFFPLSCQSSTAPLKANKTKRPEFSWDGVCEQVLPKGDRPLTKTKTSF